MPPETEQAEPGPLDRIWAILGLLAAAAVGFMAVDLLIHGRRKGPGEGEPDDKPCGC